MLMSGIPVTHAHAPAFLGEGSCLSGCLFQGLCKAREVLEPLRDAALLLLPLHCSAFSFQPRRNSGCCHLL